MKKNQIYSMLFAAAAAFGLAACADTDAQYDIPDVSAPQFVKSTPETGASNVKRGDVTVTVKYDKRVFFASSDKDKIQVTGATLTNAVVYGTDSLLTMTVNCPDRGANVSITVPEGVVTNGQGKPAAAVTVNFSTTDLAASPVAATSAEAQKLYNFLKETVDTKIISGMMANVAWNTDCADQVYEWTGKYPAINGFDYVHMPASAKGANWIDYTDITPVKNWVDNGGIVTLTWHWNVPAAPITVPGADEPAAQAEETVLTLSEEEKVMPGDWSGYLQLTDDASKALLANASVGDELIVTIKDVAAGAQGSIKNSNWTGFMDEAGTSWEYFDISGDQYSMVLDATTLADMQANGFIISGHDYTVTGVYLRTAGSVSDELLVTIYEEEMAMPGDWSGYIQLTDDASKALLANASVGDELIVKIKDVAAGAQGSIKNSNWTGFMDESGTSWEYFDISGGQYSMILDATTLADMKANGFIISGHDYTVTGVYLQSSGAPVVVDPILALDPNKDFSFYAEKTAFDAANALTEGTWENYVWKHDMAILIQYLTLLKEAHIPVLWRPFHEAAGGWFWWGKDADSFKKMWIAMFEELRGAGLDNLIWVWTSETGDDDWYPGDAYVDIIGRDLYGSSAADCVSDYAKLTATYGNKIITLSECGYSEDKESSIATITEQWNAGAKWSWFMPWYGGPDDDHPHATQEWWQDAMQNVNVITRDQVPSLK